MIKVVAPQMVQRVVDRAIQVCIIGSLCIIIQLATEVSPPGRVEFVCIWHSPCIEILPSPYLPMEVNPPSCLNCTIFLFLLYQKLQCFPYVDFSPSLYIGSWSHGPVRRQTSGPVLLLGPHPEAG